MICNLKVDMENLCFSWESDKEKQFTVQMASDPEFKRTVMYLDTRNPYCKYDGSPLAGDRRYYWRVRSGVKEWEKSDFFWDGRSGDLPLV